MQKAITFITPYWKRAVKTAQQVFYVIKVTLMVVFVLTSMLGAYVIWNAPVRNYTVDYLQGQHTVNAQGLK